MSIEGLRDHKGMLRFCLTQQVDFMDCAGDKAAVRLSVAATVRQVTFDALAPGEWTLMLIHDANGNGKLDKRFGIPREGFGFSGNPTIGFHAPSPKDVRFLVPTGQSRQNVRVHYVL